MIKKSLPILLSTLAIGLSGLSSSPAFAEIVAPGQAAYTVDELIDTASGLYEEIDATCGNTDPDCARSYYWDKDLNDNLRDALDNFYHRPFYVTSVNPSTGTVKIYFQSRDLTNMWFRANDGPAIVNYLYMGWDDADTDPSLATVGTVRPISEAYLMPNHFHYIYPATAEDSNWPPTGVEYTIELGDNSLLANTNGYFEYNFATGYTSNQGYIDYLSCINSPYYREGMECRGIFASGSDYQFVPFLNGTPAYPPYTSGDSTDNPSDNSNNDSTSDNASDNVSSDESNSNNYTASTSSVNSTTANSSSTTNTTNNSTIYNLTKDAVRSPASLAKSISGKTPERSKNNASVINASTSEASDDGVTEVPLGGESGTNCASEFPWWFIISILVVDIVVMWLAFPKKSKKI